MAQRVNKTKESRTVFLVVGKDVLDGMEVPNVTNPKTVEYVDVFVDDLPVGLPPARKVSEDAKEMAQNIRAMHDEVRKQLHASNAKFEEVASSKQFHNGTYNK
ncbi:hypothetical protein MRB53_016396 [Persea americana]|uniref:Uncharacterized protein n=1 Tax=Persea americana TaxID=3435 RepID=A0ACC2M1U8_PERAE|nr:hypothetical protein MRB53_016396 [Persea americana]